MSSYPGASPSSAATRSPKEHPVSSGSAPARHLSLGQLQSELSRVEELCRDLRTEIDARWRLEIKKNPNCKAPSSTRASGSRRCNLSSSVEERSLQVLSTAENRADLEEILQEHRDVVCRAEGAQRQLGEELAGATADVHQLSLGLPRLLESRRKELQRQLLRSEEMRKRQQEQDEETHVLQDRLGELQLAASDLQLQSDELQQQHQQEAEVAMTAESTAEALQQQCLQVERGTHEIHRSASSRRELAQRLQQEIPRWETQVLQLEQLLLQQREKLKSQLEAQQLAHHLELQTLQRRWHLHHSRLQKQREEQTWLQRLAEALEQELQRRRPAE